MTATSWPSLKGRRALVTGAATGIGAAICRLLADQGATVGLHYHSSEDAARALATETGDGRVIPLHADLCDPASRDSLVPHFVEAVGGIDILVNNAGGLAEFAPFTEVSQTGWEQTMALNAGAPFFLAGAVWPHLTAQRFGRIVNISSAAVRYGGSAAGVHYVAAKAALEAITTALAKEGARHNVLVNTVRCGLIASGMHRRVPNYSDERFVERAGMVPLGRAGQPAEVAALVAMLCADEGAFITGQCIAVAGGD